MIVNWLDSGCKVLHAMNTVEKNQHRTADCCLMLQVLCTNIKQDKVQIHMVLVRRYIFSLNKSCLLITFPLTRSCEKRVTRLKKVDLELILS